MKDEMYEILVSGRIMNKNDFDIIVLHENKYRV